MNRSPRLLLLLMAVALPLSAPAVRADVWPIPGDANLDCKVDILDLLLIRSKLGLQPADADNWKADATQDGRINILDLIAVRNSLNMRCEPLDLIGRRTGPNLLQNPGFEETTETGQLPVVWQCEGQNRYYAIDRTTSHTGSASVRWTNQDPGALVRCVQWLPGVPRTDVQYDFGVWVKTDVTQAQGSGWGASIQLQWFDESRQNLLGWHTGLPKVMGQNDWTYVGLSGVSLPPEAKSMRIICFVFWGFIGTAWFDDAQLCQVLDPPMDTFLLEPAYRGRITAGGPPAARIRANLNVSDYALSLDNLRLDAQLIRGGTEEIINQSRTVPQAATLDVQLPLTGLPAGHYTARISLVDTLNQKVIARREHALLRVPDDFAPAVSIDSHRRVLINGTAFFPLGMYTGGMDEGAMTRFCDSPFNCLTIYGSPPQDMMDRAQRHGLKVLYSLNSFFAGESFTPPEIQSPEDEERLFRERIRLFRNHPALLAWYLNDELPVYYIPRLEAHQQWAEEENPGHPTCTVLGSALEVRKYANSFDAIGTDPYPIPFDPASKAAAWTRETFQQVYGARPVWMVPQAMNWAHYYTDERQNQARAPTYAELRAMSWMCICEGATGLIYYTWEEMDKNPGMWDDLRRVATEIRDAFPMLLSTDAPPPISADAGTWFHWTARNYGGKTFIYAVSDGDGEGQATFHLPQQPATITVQGESRTITAAGESFSDPFGSLAVHTYQVEW